MQPESTENSILDLLKGIHCDVFGHYNESEFRTRATADRPNHHKTVALSQPAILSTAAPETTPQIDASIKFTPPRESAGTSFLKATENTMADMRRIEQYHIVWSDLTVEQWSSLVDWISQMVDSLKVPQRTVPIALRTADCYLTTDAGHSNPDVTAVSAAALFNATKSKYDAQSLLTRLSDLSNRPPQIIINMEETIVKTLEWNCVPIIADDYIYIMDLEVFNPLYSSLEQKSKRSLVETLLRVAYFDRGISHFVPSSIAFGCILVVIAILDPRGLKQCNALDIMSLAKRHGMSLDEVKDCVEVFVEFLNETFAGIPRVIK